MKNIKLFEEFNESKNPKYQHYYDEYMERWADAYTDDNEESDQHDDASDFAEQKLKNPKLNVEDFGPADIEEKETGAYAAPKFAIRPAAGDTGYNYVAKQFGATKGPQRKKGSKTQEVDEKD